MRLFAARVHNFILPSASTRAISVRQFSVDDFRLPSRPYSHLQPILQFGFAFAPPLVIGAAVKNKEASRKAAAIPKEPFKDSWPYLQSMLRLIRAHFRGEYRNVSQDAFLTIIAAVSYLVDPFDLIPDEIPFLGFLDDATVIGFAITRTRQALDDFMIWETTAY